MKYGMGQPKRVWRKTLAGLSLLVGVSVTVELRSVQAWPSAPEQVAQATDSLMEQVQQCVQRQLTIPTQRPPSQEEVASRCLFNIVMLNPDGSVRPDASDRMTALLQAKGVKLPKPQVQGQASVSLQMQPGQALFSLPVTLGEQTLSFILDTGASNSIIDPILAQKLGLKGKPLPSQVLGYVVVGQQSAGKQVLMYPLPPVKVGEAQVSQLMAISLSTSAPPFEAAGILGLDFLSRFDMVHNPKTRRLMLLNASAPVATGIPLKGRFGVMTTSVFVNGKGPFRFLVDTGAAYTTLSEQLIKPLALKFSPSDFVPVMGLGGQTQARRVQLASLSLQTQQVTQLNALILNSRVFQTLGIDGVLGQDVLNRFVQHWRFGPLGPLGTPETGSLELTSVDDLN